MSEVVSELIEIEKQIIYELGLVGVESYLNPQKGKVFNALLLNPKGLTQDEIMKLTELPRTVVSESVTSLKLSNLISIMKRPKERKKYYLPSVSLETAFQRYLKNILNNFQDNVIFSTDILTQIDSLSDEEKTSAPVVHFKNYMHIFQKQNHFVINEYENYLNRTDIPPKMNMEEKFRSLMHYLEKFNAILNHKPKPINIKVISNENAIRNKLDKIKEYYIGKFRRLMEKTDKNTLYPSIVNFLYLEDLPPTQERMLKILKIPRSTLSEALKKVESDRLVYSIRFPEDKKIHYFPRIPRNLLLSTKFIAMIKQLLETIKKLDDFMDKIPKNESESERITLYLQQVVLEYSSMIDFLFSLETKINIKFELDL